MKRLWLIGLLALACEHSPGSRAVVADASIGDTGAVTGDVPSTPDSSDAVDAESDTTTPDGDGPASCSEGACDDGLSCTVDHCDPDSLTCSWTLAEGTCLINNVCYPDGDAHPADGCRICDPATPHTWAAAGDGTTCDDGDPCTVSDACDGGSCEGAAQDCDDANVCTVDACVDGACVYTPADAQSPCDDGSACTKVDVCTLGLCTGQPVVCDDGDPCTTDSCAPATGCDHELHAGPCSDGDACTVGDACTDGECLAGAVTTCDDGNACTIDQCDPAMGCAHLPTQTPCCIGATSVCDDGNACTVDLCDPETVECDYEPAGEVDCDDGLQCTADDVCDGTTCVGQAATCDDGNPCTEDSCAEGTGCSFVELSGQPCDDGLECTVETACLAGQCVGDDSACECDPPLSGDAVKIASLAIGLTGQAGDGLDLDGDPSTCSPTPSCADGVHNSFSALAALANPAVEDALDGGDIMLAIEVPDDLSGSFPLHLYQVEVVGACDFQSATCDYLVKQDSFDPETCAALFALPASIDGAEITAGGPGSVIPFSFPVQGLVLDVSIFNAQLQAVVTTDDTGVVALTGLLGGAVKKTTLLAAVDNLPDEGLPVPKDLIKTVLTSTLQYDIDTDGDGEGDAASIGLQVQAIDANLTGVE